MYKSVKTGYIILQKNRSTTEKTVRITYDSKKWVIWRTIVSPTTCEYCASMNGHILSKSDPCIEDIPVHDNCRCSVQIVTAIAVGTATSDGRNGVDLYVATHGMLPENYLRKKEAQKQGWHPLLGNLDEVLPGILIGGDKYKNRDGRLPDAPGRVWCEADFDYTGGYRNNCRLLYSNDGLIFVTYDHYLTFYEIGLEVLP